MGYPGQWFCISHTPFPMQSSGHHKSQHQEVGWCGVCEVGDSRDLSAGLCKTLTPPNQCGSYDHWQEEQEVILWHALQSDHKITLLISNHLVTCQSMHHQHTLPLGRSVTSPIANQKLDVPKYIFLLIWGLYRYPREYSPPVSDTQATNCQLQWNWIVLDFWNLTLSSQRQIG